jgi:hypothetical protein
MRKGHDDSAAFIPRGSMVAFFTTPVECSTQRIRVTDLLRQTVVNSTHHIFANLRALSKLKDVSD